MVYTNTIICQTQNTISAGVPAAIIDPLTGENAYLPTGATLSRIDIYRDSDNPVTDGCGIQFGNALDTQAYIADSEGLSTANLNTGHMITRQYTSSVGLAVSQELRLTLDSDFTEGDLIFEVTYSTWT